MKSILQIFYPSLNINFYEELIETLENGSQNSIDNILWHPDKTIIYLPLTYKLIESLKKPENTSSKLQVKKKSSSGIFEMIILSVPWRQSDFPYEPLLVNKRTKKIVGIMMPFNELHSFLSRKHSNDIAELSVKWALSAFRKNLDLFDE